VRVYLLGSDLITRSRVDAVARRHRIDLEILDSPASLPAGAGELLLVDWGERRPDWGPRLAEWRRQARGDDAAIVLFGPHRDVAGHAEARRHGLGPVRARSSFFAILEELFATRISP
jgi:hypothetical protein